MDNRVFGDFNIVRQIGQGSLGTVYLAEHRFIKKHYIIKLLPQELISDRAFIQRFEEGVSKLATLDHPNIVKIHNVSSFQGCYFLVMDCVVDSIGETTNLSQYLGNKGGMLTEKELHSILLQIADAMDYGHSKKGHKEGIAHERLKLNNVLIGNNKEGINVLLSDFGLAKLVGIGRILSRTYKVLADVMEVLPMNGHKRIEKEGYAVFSDNHERSNRLHQSFLQNYFFLAPEQKCVGDVDYVGIKADVYAFGVLAYYMITREFPQGVFEMPSQKSPGLEMNWDLLIWHCLQRDPNRRPLFLCDAMETLLKQKNTMAFSHSSVTKHHDYHTEKQSAINKPLVARGPYEKDNENVAKMEVKSKELEEICNSNPDVIGNSFREGLHVRQYQPKPVEVKNVEPLLTDVVVICGDTYLRGSSGGSRDEMPLHHVTIGSFAIDIHPVTNEQFILFLEKIGVEKDNNNNDIINLRESRIKRLREKLSIESGYAKHPVVGVTWYGAVAYAHWVGRRLPTEAEWEVACRGGIENMLYPTGDSIEKSQSNFFSSDTTAVKSYSPNGFGLYDMVGNVYEWCHDWYGYDYYEESAQEPNNPKGPLQGVYRVLRGGCWKSLKKTCDARIDIVIILEHSIVLTVFVVLWT